MHDPYALDPAHRRGGGCALCAHGRDRRPPSEDYILAHIAHGFSPARILLHHILWLQCWPLLVRQAAFVFGYVLFVETGLSYLGDYGVQEPDPSWGNMVAQVKELEGAGSWPWLAPALAIVLTISAFLAFGNLVARKGEESLR